MTLLEELENLEGQLLHMDPKENITLTVEMLSLIVTSLVNLATESINQNKKRGVL